ncbi:hypothetical protein ACFGVR_04855 [Mucilaginibacter sp. AW1-3]
MFEKLFLLVKNNAGKAVIGNPEIAEKDREAVITEASSSIIDVLKKYIETGKMQDLVGYFQLNGIYNNPMVNSMVNKFANRLNKYYDIAPNSAFKIADALIPQVMVQFIQQTRTEKSMGAMFTQLNGNRADLSGLVNGMLMAS